MAINSAMEDIRAGKTGAIPRQLQNKHYDGADAKVKGQFYNYPHDFKNHWVEQQYLPNAIKDAIYYVPAENKTNRHLQNIGEKSKENSGCRPTAKT